MSFLQRFLSWLLGLPVPPSNPPETSPSPPSGELPSVPKAKDGLGLDAGDFQPATGAELQAEARALRNRFGNPWFGRRDLIPPADDPRTRLIDRGMVTAGVLTPEQLVEIHTVAAEMDRLRPTETSTEHQSQRAGAAAVEADRAARAEVKARKKAEAAERKRLRAEAIAHRHATDILFLGRGVSGRLNDRFSHRERLDAAGLPFLSTPADLAEALGLSIPKLRWLAFHGEVATRVHYATFRVPKRSGGTRTLSAPHLTLAAAQRWIFENVLARLPIDDRDSAQGFIPGRSILTNARRHVGRAVVLNLDLEDFFPSVGFPRVRSVFARAGYSPAVATILALLCTECPRRPVRFEGRPYFVATGPRGLPQGACTSPGLSNQVARRLDRRLRGLAERLGLTYTRYADDLTFSGDDPLTDRVGYVIARVRHIAAEEGFVIKESKTRVLRRGGAQTVTGLIVNDRPGIPRAEVRRLRAILHRAKTEGLEAQNRAGHPNFSAWLLGKIAYVSMVQPDLGARLRAEYEALRTGS